MNMINFRDRTPRNNQVILFLGNCLVSLLLSYPILHSVLIFAASRMHNYIIPSFQHRYNLLVEEKKNVEIHFFSSPHVYFRISCLEYFYNSLTFNPHTPICVSESYDHNTHLLVSYFSISVAIYVVETHIFVILYPILLSCLSEGKPGRGNKAFELSTQWKSVTGYGIASNIFDVMQDIWYVMWLNLTRWTQASKFICCSELRKHKRAPSRPR